MTDDRKGKISDVGTAGCRMSYVKLGQNGIVSPLIKLAGEAGQRRRLYETSCSWVVIPDERSEDPESRKFKKTGFPRIGVRGRLVKPGMTEL